MRTPPSRMRRRPAGAAPGQRDRWLRWPVLFGVYSEQQAMDILDVQLDLIF